MNSQDEDRDLRESFALQRSQEEKRVTEFQRLLARSPTLSQGRGRIPARQSRAALSPVPIVAAILVVLVLVTGQALQLFEPMTPSGTLSAASLDGWTAPTAFLLRTPGHDFLSSVPVLARAVPTLESGAPPNSPVPPHTPTK